MFFISFINGGWPGGSNSFIKKLRQLLYVLWADRKPLERRPKTFFMGASLTASFDKYISLWRIVSHRDILATVRHRVFLFNWDLLKVPSVR